MGGGLGLVKIIPKIYRIRPRVEGAIMPAYLNRAARPLEFPVFFYGGPWALLLGTRRPWGAPGLAA